ncbi:hypothetical protein B5S33_g2970 [[Candida] boidinii]|nr:hypothetical protein B5S30_g1607 [[Candida] boidinii]OWB84327.1 hypothetical protein B5S33_g2970 [[Candida] boidinii]
MTYKKVESQDENPFSKLVNNQTIVEIPEFELESGDIIYNVPVAYKTWGKLNEKGDNCMIITHALTGSADVADWWGPLLARGKAFDPTKFFIICLNSLGSPYGSASPLTMDHEFGERYGPEFPLCTIRDDINIHKLVLDSLGVKSVAICIGGSMGGMLALEWLFVENGEFVKNVVALATSAKHSAWCISWGEAQRQCIYSDPKYDDGYYPLDDPPNSGLGAARMSAMLTYRSRNSFEKKFGRASPSDDERKKLLRKDIVQTHKNSKQEDIQRRDENSIGDVSAIDDSSHNSNEKSNNSDLNTNHSDKQQHWSVHNDGSTRKTSFESHHTSRSNSLDSSVSFASLTIQDTHSTSVSSSPLNNCTNEDGETHSTERKSRSSIDFNRQRRRPQHFFSAQNYLRYQAQKFISRFDANCYIAITRKLDTHDVGRDRPEFDNDTAKALQSRKQPALIVGIQSDALFTYSEQIFIAKNMPNSKLHKISSQEGHDAFLLEFKEINDLIIAFENENLKEIMTSKGNNEEWTQEQLEEGKKESVFGEAEDVANW